MTPVIIGDATLHIGDCIEVMRDMADGSVDSIVTDPPYELGFMGKAWDASGIANRVDMWAEALRVLKPGGHLLAFSGSRTYHRMTCAIEDAGFEIRDQVMWVYGSGFPKSLDVSKAIDKAGATSTAWFGAWLKHWREDRKLSQKDLCERCGFFGAINRGGTVANWETGAGAPTVTQFNKICEVLSLPFASIDEAQREVIGVRSVNAGVAFTSYGPTEIDITASATDAARQWEGWGTALKPAHEPIVVARKPLVGTVAANVLQFGTGALNIDGCRVEFSGDADKASAKPGGKATSKNTGSGNGAAAPDAGRSAERVEFQAVQGAGRWPANIIHDGSDEVMAHFPQASGAVAPVRGNEPSSKTDNTFGQYAGRAPSDQRDGGGSAARFFYCAKASRKDRNEGLDDPGPQFKLGTTLRDVENTATKGNTHPTVKPTDLMAYLCRLVTPPGGLVLDPFMGSGSTGKAAMREGFRFIGIDMSAEYVQIAQARIQHELKKPLQKEMFA